MRKPLVALLLLALTLPVFGRGRGASHSSRSRASASRRSSHPKVKRPRHKAPKRPKASCATCVRDGRGRIKRSPRAKTEFQRTHPCPATGKTSGPCPGYVIDHVTPLKRGGADHPSNMQWQTKAQAKAKDRIE